MMIMLNYNQYTWSIKTDWSVCQVSSVLYFNFVQLSLFTLKRVIIHLYCRLQVLNVINKKIRILVYILSVFERHLLIQSNYETNKNLINFLEIFWGSQSFWFPKWIIRQINIIIIIDYFILISSLPIILYVLVKDRPIATDRFQFSGPMKVYT